MEFEIRVRAKRITARENEVRLKLKISAIVLCFFFFLLAKQMRNESAKCVLEWSVFSVLRPLKLARNSTSKTNR